jgi:putative nucleotidyltransferase with HDIG domain
MANGRIKKTLNTLPEIVKYLLVAAVVLGISLLCPNHVQLNFQFEKGGRWRYEDLYAPFDFAIRKAEIEFKADKEQLKSSFSPYYQFKPEVAQDKKRKFAVDFEQQFDLIKGQDIYQDIVVRPGVYKRFGLELINNVYNRGIIGLAPQHKEKGKDFVINLLRGNTSQKKTLESLPSSQSVQNNISDSLFNSGLKEAEFLIPLLENAFVPNILYNDTLTQRFLSAEVDQLATTRGAVEKGELIVKNGEIITDETFRKLNSFSSHYAEQLSVQRSYWSVFGGYLLLTSLVVVIFMLYLQFNENRVFKRFSNLLFILMWVMLYSYLVYVMEQSDFLSAYLIPFCIAPIVIKNFYNDRLALFTHIGIVLIASYLSTLDYEFTFLQITAGIVAVLTNTETRFWSRFFTSILLILLTYSLGYLGLSLVQEGSFNAIDFRVYFMLFLSTGLTLLAYPLIPLLEKLFGFTSAISLAELSDLNRPLLKELSLKAPGTLQHSLQVANLSEAAARRVGANPLLVKAAALYHDVGKMKQPEFFIENQSGKNPHNDLNDALDSAKIIISHVTEGARLARKHRIPAVLIDFIKTHHGTTRVEYFFRKYQDENPDIDFDESIFRYPGPKPRSKEETILMLADSLEAASKSLQSPTGKDIDELVDRIVGGKIAHGQLEESELTFQELQACREEFRKLLRSINHVRVEYPTEKKEA